MEFDGEAKKQLASNRNGGCLLYNTQRLLQTETKMPNDLNNHSAFFGLEFTA